MLCGNYTINRQNVNRQGKFSRNYLDYISGQLVSLSGDCIAPAAGFSQMIKKGVKQMKENLEEQVKLKIGNALPFGFAGYEEVLPLLPCRGAKRIPEGAATVIVFLFPYYVEKEGGRNLSRYSMIADYHRVAGDFLEKACQSLSDSFLGFSFAPFTDNSPIREVRAAELAGLGEVGENGLLIHPEYGSYVFIGEIVTDLKLEPTRGSDVHGGRHCTHCGLCRASCPNNALSGNGVELPLCRSHITQKKGELSSFEAEQVRRGGLIWGCDICNEICPANNKPKQTEIQDFLDSAVPWVTEENLEAVWGDRAFAYRGRAVVLRNLRVVYPLDGQGL